MEHLHLHDTLPPGASYYAICFHPRFFGTWLQRRSPLARGLASQSVNFRSRRLYEYCHHVLTIWGKEHGMDRCSWCSHLEITPVHSISDFRGQSPEDQGSKLEYFQRVEMSYHCIVRKTPPGQLHVLSIKGTELALIFVIVGSLRNSDRQHTASSFISLLPP